jgi:hypothetical protein
VSITTKTGNGAAAKAAAKKIRRERRRARSVGAVSIAARAAGAASVAECKAEMNEPNKVIEMPNVAERAKESNVTPLWSAAKAVDTIRRASADGYFPITIMPHTLKDKNAGKKPSVLDRGSWVGWKDWETQVQTATLDSLIDWQGQTNSNPNVGVLTGIKTQDGGFFIGTDIDCEASDLVDNIAKLAGGDIAIRKGRPGRSGMIALVVDELGDHEKFQCGDDVVQLLREGKQFVAAGIHPDTKRPYRWEDTDELPVNMPALADLPRVKMADLVRVLAKNGLPIEVQKAFVTEGLSPSTPDTGD